VAKYFAVNGVLRFSVALPQAFLTPILVSKGLTFSEVALVQSVYMLVAFVSEVPSGYLADVTSRKIVYTGSMLVTAAGYAVVLTQHGVAMMAIAWALYGLGQSLQSSTMEYHFVAVLRDDERKFARFYVLERNIPLLASVGAALLATALFPRIGDRLYLISLLGFVTCFVLGTIVLPGGSRGARRSASPRSTSSGRWPSWTSASTATSSVCSSSRSRVPGSSGTGRSGGWSAPAMCSSERPWPRGCSPWC
jgi:MFS family permease